MNLEDQLLLDTPDERLNSFARNRKRRLQTQIAARREARRPLLADPGEKPGPRQPASLTADQQSPWKQHEAGRRQARVASDTQADRVERVEREHERWRTTPKRDPITAELKRHSDASRTPAKRPAFTLTRDLLDTLLVCAEAVMRKHPDLFLSSFNGTSLNNCVQTRLGKGWQAGQTIEALVCPHLVEDAFQECLAGNHLELAYTRDENGNRVRKRGEAILAPPTLYPKYIWPDEARLLAERERAEALRLNSVEAQRAIALPFEELQAKVRAGHKRGGNEDGR